MRRMNGGIRRLTKKKTTQLKRQDAFVPAVGVLPVEDKNVFDPTLLELSVQFVGGVRRSDTVTLLREREMQK
jgi:hypothetical protein